MIFTMPLICTTVRQGHGQRLISVRRVFGLQLHLLETSPFLWEVEYKDLILRIPLICTTVRQDNGRLLGSACRASKLQLQRLETLQSSRGAQARGLISTPWIRIPSPSIESRQYRSTLPRPTASPAKPPCPSLSPSRQPRPSPPAAPSRSPTPPASSRRLSRPLWRRARAASRG